MNNQKVIIITGGASGLGLAFVDFFSKLKDYVVIVFDINKTALEEIANPEIDKYCLDLLKENEVVKNVNIVYKKYGHIDILINNAGAIYNEMLINMMNPEQMRHNYDNFKKYMAVNLDTVFLMGSNVAETMVKSRTKGVIINISSISSKGNAGQSAYSAAKAGINALTKTWAKELGALGIRVVSISPGFIDISSTNNALNPSIIKHIKCNTPLRKLGNPENIVHTAKYIIDNSFLTGTIIEVDGGLVF